MANPASLNLMETSVQIVDSLKNALDTINDALNKADLKNAAYENHLRDCDGLRNTFEAARLQYEKEWVIFENGEAAAYQRLQTEIVRINAMP